jgi:glucokinase
MPADSGTSTEWLTTLSRTLVNVHCECPAELAASRFAQRRRHPGHLDSTRSVAEVLASIQALPPMAYLGIGERIVIDTTTTIDRTLLVQLVEAAFARC